MYQSTNPYQNPGATMTPNQNMSYANFQSVGPNPYLNNGVANWNMPYPNNYNYQPRPQIAGRMIGNISEVVPNEVPMDGSVSFFPQSDYSCIYAKKWNTDGTIQTVKFVPVVESEKSQQTSMDDIRKFNTDLATDISNISDRLDKIEKLLSTRTTRSAKEESK